MKKVLFISGILLFLSIGNLFSQSSNSFYIGFFLGPSFYFEGGTLGKPKELDGSLGTALAAVGSSDVSYEKIQTGAFSLGLELGYNISSSAGIGANILFMLPVAFSMKSYGERTDLNTDDWDSFFGFNMIVGPVFTPGKNFKLLTGFHFNTYAMKTDETAYDSGVKINFLTKLSYTNLGLGVSGQGKINFTKNFYGFINIQAGFDFFEIKKADIELTGSTGAFKETLSGSAKWTGATFNFEFTPVIGVGISY
jgi:hypothetical protein